MKRVLVTGASGFIGRYCLPLLLENGYDVHAVFNKTNVRIPNIHWHWADLLIPAQVGELIAKVKPTHLLHLSWYTEPGKYWTSPENFRWVQASLELLREFTSEGGKRVVVAGTCAEYEWKSDYYSEQTTPLFPSTVYGTCKHALQTMLEAFSRQTGLSSAWGRVFFLYGPHEHPERLVSSVIRSLLQEEPARCSNGNQVRDFLHVEDVASAFVRLLDSELTGAANIGSGKPTTIREVVNTIGDQLHRKPLLHLGALPGSTEDPAVLVADVQRLKSTGWQPKYDLKTGLEQTIDWWKTTLIMAKG